MALKIQLKFFRTMQAWVPDFFRSEQPIPVADAMVFSKKNFMKTKTFLLLETITSNRKDLQKILLK